MSERLTLGSLCLLALLLPGVCQAQYGYGYGPGGATNAVPVAGQPPAPPAGYQTLPPGYQPVPGNYQGPQPAPNTFYEQFPDDIGLGYDGTQFKELIANTFRRSYFRGEYLLWSVTAPAPNLVGLTPAPGFYQPTNSQAPNYSAPGVISTTTLTQPQNPVIPPASIAEPIFPNTFGLSQNGLVPQSISSNALQVIVPSPLLPSPSGGATTASAIEPSLAGFDLKGLNGYRGTFGFAVGPGVFEASAWILGTGSATWNGTGYITSAIPVVAPAVVGTDANYIAQVVNIDGTQHALLYTTGYQDQLKTNVWGSEANYILDAFNAGMGEIFTISPLVGVRYFGLRETFDQGGGYTYLTNPSNPTSTATTSATRYINSQSSNHAYGLQFGLRGEAAINRFTFGAEPKIMFGANTYNAGLATSALDISEATAVNNVYNTAMSFQKTQTVFSPMADLKLYSRVNLTQYLNFYVSYNMIWAGSMSRAYNNMGYNFSSSGAGLFHSTLSDVVVQGLSVGGELRY